MFIPIWCKNVLSIPDIDITLFICHIIEDCTHCNMGYSILCSVLCCRLHISDKYYPGFPFIQKTCLLCAHTFTTEMLIYLVFVSVIEMQLVGRTQANSELWTIVMGLSSDLPLSLWPADFWECTRLSSHPVITSNHVAWQKMDVFPWGYGERASGLCFILPSLCSVMEQGLCSGPRAVICVLTEPETRPVGGCCLKLIATRWWKPTSATPNKLEKSVRSLWWISLCRCTFLSMLSSDFSVISTQPVMSVMIWEQECVLLLHREQVIIKRISRGLNWGEQAMAKGIFSFVLPLCFSNEFFKCESSFDFALFPLYPS